VIASQIGFDWFTGLAEVSMPCPAAMARPHGLQRFFGSPNHDEFGVRPSDFRLS